MTSFVSSLENKTLPAFDDLDDVAHIQSEFDAFRLSYQKGWNTMLKAWQRESTECRLWLMYACNYLFNTHGIQWAIDPLFPTRLLDLPDPVPLEPLRDLAFVLLTHDHHDHFDAMLISSLSGSSTKVIVPEAILDRVHKQTTLPDSQIIIAYPNQPIQQKGIRILPFESWHSSPENPASIGYKSMGYAVEVGAQRLLFPVDIRDYPSVDLAEFKSADWLFAHLWLGRQCALMERPPLLDDFIDFLRRCDAQRIMVAHLYEFSREPNDLWHRRHLRDVLKRWYNLQQKTPIFVPQLFEEIRL